MAARVAGSGNGKEAGSEFDRIGTVDHHLRARLRRQFLAMDDAAARKTGGVFIGLGYVVAVRQEDVRDSAHAVDQMRQELGRVDEPVALRPLYEVARATVRFR